jgi:hypothetical protein
MQRENSRRIKSADSFESHATPVLQEFEKIICALFVDSGSPIFDQIESEKMR